MSEVAENVETVEEKKYVMRPLGSDDIYTMLDIISAIGIKNFSPIFSSDDVKKRVKKFKAEGGEEDNVESVGVVAILEVADVILKNMKVCKPQIQSFLGDLLGMTAEEVGKIPPVAYLRLLKELFNREDFKDFFGEALQFLK